ncbi:hypothetical protein BpHYR1_000146 [Brachionus plicatilis]|uniref:Uncharacterized protein n=1 Tax=Brachionus plicatilis TaxID=10195 RepID=A0A3M7SCY3_BRAPC|nr:hypothetical protein BpHYR1_000146 [Brachionus plicatilis]
MLIYSNLRSLSIRNPFILDYLYSLGSFFYLNCDSKFGKCLTDRQMTEIISRLIRPILAEKPNQKPTNLKDTTIARVNKCSTRSIDT